MPAPQSSCSTSATRSPRRAASRATPQPLMPPPTTTTSKRPAPLSMLSRSMAPRGYPIAVALDQGTTGTRAVRYALRDDGLVVEGDAYREHAQHTPAPGHVEHDAEEIAAAAAAVLDAGRRRRRRARHREPDGDPRRLGRRDPPPAAPGPRVAEPPGPGGLRAARPARLCAARPHRAAARPDVLRPQARLAARARAGRRRRGGAGDAAPRDDRLLARRPADRRRGPRDGRVQRLAHPPLRPRRGGLRARPVRPRRRARGRAAGGGGQRRRGGRDGCGRPRRGAARRPAGGALRPRRARRRAGQVHVRHRRHGARLHRHASARSRRRACSRPSPGGSAASPRTRSTARCSWRATSSAGCATGSG